MPNIIEQQDLLKSIPDARLATLLQNPVADIPPFLVAAEAQRRQSIRQQFATPDQKESVVDSLKRQLAGVPENVKAPEKAPPVIPQTPEMAGVAALQAQNDAQKAAQEAAGGQQMSGGGQVMRFAGGGRAPGATPQPSYFGAIPRVYNEYAAPYVDAAIQSVTGSGLGQAASNTWNAITEYERNIREQQANEPKPPAPYTTSQFDPKSYNAIKAAKAAAAKPPASEDSGRNNTSPDNQNKPDTQKEGPDKYRQQIEDLYGSQEPSGWEKASKWFAMSEQFLDPSKTTFESIAGAGRAFSEGMADEKRGIREAELAQKKALLEYDLSLESERRAAAAEAQKRELEYSLKEHERMTPSAGDVMDSIGTQIKAYMSQIEKINEDPYASDEEKAKKAAVYQNQIDALTAQLHSLTQNAGYNLDTIPTTAQLRAQVSGQQ